MSTVESDNQLMPVILVQNKIIRYRKQKYYQTNGIR